MVADGKKLFMWREVLSLLPEGRVWKSWHPGWEGSATVLPARARILEVYRSWREGRLPPMTLSAKRMIRCSLSLSLAVATVYQTVMEDRLDDVEVRHHL